MVVAYNNKIVDSQCKKDENRLFGFENHLITCLITFCVPIADISEITNKLKSKKNFCVVLRWSRIWKEARQTSIPSKFITKKEKQRFKNIIANSS